MNQQSVPSTPAGGQPGPGPATAGPPGPPGGWLSQRMSRQEEIIFNIMVAFLQLIPQSTLTTVFPISRIIAESFTISKPSILPWLVAAYALSFGTLILIGGRLGDIFGYKTMVVIGYCSISVWSVVAGLSRYAGFELFLVARGFQGLGASLMVPNGLALLGRSVVDFSRARSSSAYEKQDLCTRIKTEDILLHPVRALRSGRCLPGHDIWRLVCRVRHVVVVLLHARHRHRTSGRCRADGSHVAGADAKADETIPGQTT